MTEKELEQNYRNEQAQRRGLAERLASLPASPCSQDRFKDWTVEDYEKEIRRVEASRRHLESVIPKLKRILRRDELRAFDPSI